MTPPLSPTWTAPGPTSNDRPVSLSARSLSTEPDESLTGQASVNVTIRANQRPSGNARGRPDDRRRRRHGDALTATATDPEGESMTLQPHFGHRRRLHQPNGPGSDVGRPCRYRVDRGLDLTVFSANDGARTGTAVATVIVRRSGHPTAHAAPSWPPSRRCRAWIVNELPARSHAGPYAVHLFGDRPPNWPGFRNRRVQGIPMLPGAYTVSYVVTDSNQDLVERTFTWTITGDIIPQPTGLNMRSTGGTSSTPPLTATSRAA